MNIDNILKELNEQNFRITKPRKKIIEILLDNRQKHLTIEKIAYVYKQKNPKNFTLATLYNNLKVLEEAKVIKKHHFKEMNPFYEINEKIHGHFICTKCQKIIDLDIPGLHCLPLLDMNDEILIHGSRIEFYGYCESCKKDE